MGSHHGAVYGSARTLVVAGASRSAPSPSKPNPHPLLSNAPGPLVSLVPSAAATSLKLDTKETSPDFVPPRARLYRSVRLTERAYRHKVAEQLRTLSPDTADPGEWLRRAFALRGCGEHVVVARCADCKLLNLAQARVLATCGMRTCPGCARMRSNRFRGKICYAAEQCELDGFGYYLLTFTQRFDPCSEVDLSVEGIGCRYRRVAEGVKYVWQRVLKADGRAMAVSFEVGPGGVMHAHAIFYGPRPDVRAVRAAWLLHVADSPQVRSDPMPDREAALREVAKYVTKGASPKRGGGGDRLGSYTDPELAAKVEIALHGKRLTEVYGAWRGQRPPRAGARSNEEKCPSCEGDNLSEVLMPREQVVRLLPEGAELKFTRGGRRRRRRESVGEKGSENGNGICGAAQQTHAEGAGGGTALGRQSQDGARHAASGRAPSDSLGAHAAHPYAGSARAIGTVAGQLSWC